MTIKHLGGIFGRNPTFNDVTIDGGVYLGGTFTTNYLDDYKEGTWTPSTFSAGSTSVTLGASSSAAGQFTKIGNTVFGAFQLDLDDPGESVAVGDLFQFGGGLPYQPAETNVHACGDLLVYGSIGSNLLAVGNILIGSGRAQYYKISQVSGAVNYGMVIQGRFSYRVDE